MNRCTDWSDVAIVVGIVILAILTAGDYDLLDAIIKNVGR